MPPSGVPPADLSSQLLSLLLRSGALLAVAALAVAVGTWVLARRSLVGGRRFALAPRPTGASTDREPSARRFLRRSLGVLWILDGLLQAQPRMPAGFVAQVIQPGLTSAPSWLHAVVEPLAGMWTRHPVAADVVTVWVQLGLGLLLLIGGGSRFERAVVSVSLAWSIGIWVLGEFLGGLLQPGASWLAGAPGAALVYAIASALLLAPWSWWSSGRCALITRRIVGAWLLIGALLQALPGEGSWSADGLSEPFRAGAQMNQPQLLGRPISALAGFTSSHPVAINAVVIAALVSIGLGLCLSARSEYVVGGIALCALTWWLAQDFGVLGGTATDPNTGLPLALLLVSALPRWSRATGPAAGRASARGATRWREYRQPSVAGLTALGLGALVIAPLVVTGHLLGPAGADAVAADSGGGVVQLAHRPAPDFSLTDQAGRPVSLRGLRGRLTLVTFLDPECSDECPLIADQLALANTEIGDLRERVEIVAIDSNPVFHSVSDVAAFTDAHGLGDLPNWHFVTGSDTSVQAVLAAWGMVIAVPAVGMIEHSEGIFFVLPDGSQAAYLPDGANADLTSSYADQIRDEVRNRLK